jgi:hypothetical protein
VTSHRLSKFTGAAAAVGAGVLMWRSGRRSGATDDEIAKSLSGDDVVREPTLICDRATTYAQPVERVWPWVLQLGKDRGGWYLPMPLALLVPVSRRGSRVIQPALQHLAVGDVVPDWGPMPFTVHAVEPCAHVVYTAADSGRRRPLHMSWALVVTPDGSGTRLHLRLRLQSGTRFPAVLQTLRGVIDYLTVEMMFAGLRQRLG